MSEKSSLKAVMSYSKMEALAKYMADNTSGDATISVGVADYACDVGVDDVCIMTVSPSGEVIDSEIREELQWRIESAADTIDYGEPISYDATEIPVMSYSIETEVGFCGVLFFTVKPAMNTIFNVCDLGVTELEEGLERMISDMLPHDEGNEGNRMQIWCRFGNFGFGNHLFE